MREKVELPELGPGGDREPRDARRAARVVRALWEPAVGRAAPGALWRGLSLPHHRPAPRRPGLSHQPPGRDPALGRARLSQDRPPPGRDLPCGRRTALEDARAVVVAYGSTARSARQAVKMARARYGRKVGLLRLKTLWPFPEEVVERAAETRAARHRGRDEPGPDGAGGGADRGPRARSCASAGPTARWSPRTRSWTPCARRKPSRRDVPDAGQALVKEESNVKRHDQGTYEYLRHHKKFPHVWCAGCGIGIVMGSILRAVQRAGAGPGRRGDDLGHRLHGPHAGLCGF